MSDWLRRRAGKRESERMSTRTCTAIVILYWLVLLVIVLIADGAIWRWLF